MQLHQEIQQLAHQLQLSQRHIPAVINQQVKATTAPQTAQLNVLAEGLQQAHLIALIAQAAVANALAAPLPRAPAPAVADMSMDHDAYNDHLCNPVNPRLPHYTSAEDPVVVT